MLHTYGLLTKRAVKMVLMMMMMTHCVLTKFLFCVFMGKVIVSLTFADKLHLLTVNVSCCSFKSGMQLGKCFPKISAFHISSSLEWIFIFLLKSTRTFFQVVENFKKAFYLKMQFQGDTHIICTYIKQESKPFGKYWSLLKERSLQIKRIVDE